MLSLLRICARAGVLVWIKPSLSFSLGRLRARSGGSFFCLREKTNKQRSVLLSLCEANCFFPRSSFCCLPNSKNVFSSLRHYSHVTTQRKKKQKKKEENKTMTTARSNEKGKRDDEPPPEALWRLFREGLMEGGECRDIVEKHILPRLNRTDIKFLYDVNSETRALIKRSSRRKALKRKFKIEEMSSISTLEFAWNNIQWAAKDEFGCVIDQPRWFCRKVALTDKLELLKWIREEKKCEWDERTLNVAAILGNLDMIKYCVANGCPVDEWACAHAAYHGDLECLKYLHEEGNAPWDWRAAAMAAEHGHLHILEYLFERKYDKYGAAVFVAARNGHLDCLKYLHETAKVPFWDEDAIKNAHKNNQHECLQYLLDKNCPLPEGWSYDGGVLIAASESEEESEEEESEEEESEED